LTAPIPRFVPRPDAAFAVLHAVAFADGAERPWSLAELHALVEGSGAFLLAAGDPLAGFALARVAADEAELLTLAVDPLRRRQGVGRALLAAAMAEAARRGAAAMLLEVASGSSAAQALYATAGFTVVGRRRAYHARPGRPTEDALVMRRALAARDAP
jgi:ribosomal-protein-alanine N-acetyltransferase